MLIRCLHDPVSIHFLPQRRDCSSPLSGGHRRREQGILSECFDDPLPEYRDPVAGKYHRTRQALWSYSLTFRFTTDAGELAYLDGKTVRVEQVDFVQKYFPDKMK